MSIDKRVWGLPALLLSAFAWAADPPPSPAPPPPPAPVTTITPSETIPADDAVPFPVDI